MERQTYRLLDTGRGGLWAKRRGSKGEGTTTSPQGVLAEEEMTWAEA